MDDVQIIASRSSGEEKGPGLKILLVIVLIISISAGVAGLSYFIGTRFGEKPQISDSQTPPTPTTLISPTEAVPTANPSVSKKPLPTSKKSPTPSPTPKPILKTKILPSVADLDGFRSSNGGGNNSLEIRAGRNSSLVTRGFISFEINDIPSDANIQSATLRLYQTKVVGNPYDVGGSLMLDHLTYGDALDSTDYALPALSTNFITLSSSQKIGWKEVDVNERVKDDVANARSISQYRVHFETEVTGGDAAGDFVYFEAQENSTGSKNTPQLVVKYHQD